jgi:hypothetical protein
MNGVLNLEELRTRGFSEDDFSDGDLLKLETRVWDTIMLFTNRVFENRGLTLRLDGTGTNELFIPESISTIASVTVDDTAWVEGTDFVVYNRVVPDDRESPKLIALDTVFTEGSQNVVIVGVFGYTDPYSDAEYPPSPLIEVAMRMMPIFAEHLLEGAELEVEAAATKRGLYKESTDKWAYTRFPKAAIENSLLDDPFINAILLKYRKCNDSIFGDWV